MKLIKKCEENKYMYFLNKKPIYWKTILLLTFTNMLTEKTTNNLITLTLMTIAYFSCIALSFYTIISGNANSFIYWVTSCILLIILSYNINYNYRDYVGYYYANILLSVLFISLFFTILMWFTLAKGEGTVIMPFLILLTFIQLIPVGFADVDVLLGNK